MEEQIIAEQDSANALLQLDLSKINLGPDGVHDFFWPLARDSHLPELKRFVPAFFACLRSLEADAPDDVLSMRILLKWFLVDIGSLHHAALLLNAVEVAGMSINPGPRTPYVAALLGDAAAPMTVFSGLAAGAPAPQAVPRLARRLIREWQWNRPRHRIRAALNQGVVLLNPTPLTLAHADRAGVPLRYAHLTDWFPPAAFDPVCVPAETGELAQAITAAAAATLPTSWRRLSTMLPAYVDRWMSLARNFLETFDPGRRGLPPLPEELWVGPSSAGVWVRTLTSLVLARGGTVVSHDHGNGDNHSDQYPQHLIEFVGSSRFITYTWAGAEEKRDGLDSSLLCGFTPPRIEALGPRDEPALPVTQQEVKGSISNVLYISTIYSFEHPKFTSSVAAPVYLDFQARLLMHLASLGIDVSLKSHPQDPDQPVGALVSSTGCSILSGRFEDITQSFDAYVIDFPNSSMTRAVLESQKPVIFIDVGYPALTQRGQALLERRCERVPTTQDGRGRLRYDRDLLELIVKRSQFRFDDAFTSTYYGRSVVG